MSEIKKEFTNEEKVEFFKEELKFIKRDDIRELAMDLLRKTQNYFFYVPASSTGKYHPKYTTGEHGLMLHTRALMCILEGLSSLEHYGFTNDEKDLLFVAGLVHDTVKLGDDPDGYTVNEHPILAADRVREYIGSGIITDDELNYIASAVESHMGQWNTDKNGNAILPKPVTAAQKIIHDCDFLASRKYIEINFAGYEEAYKNKVKKPKAKKEKKYEKAVALYNEGKTLEEIEKELDLGKDRALELLVKAYMDGNWHDLDKFIDPEREKEILVIASDASWNGFLRVIKEKVANVTYGEIHAVLAKHKKGPYKEKGIVETKEESTGIITKMKKNEYAVSEFMKGKSIENISDEIGVAQSTVEEYILKAARENDDIKIDSFIDTKYEQDILDIITKESWNGRLKPVKEMLPEEVSYNCIRAVIVKHKVYKN